MSAIVMVIMNTQEIKDKAIFVASLVVIFFGLTPFRESFSKIIAYTNETYTLTIWQLVLVLIVCLMISIYLYALTYIFGKHTNNIFYRWIIRIANFFYAFALIYPIFIIIGSLIIISPIGKFGREHTLGLAIFDIIGTIIVVILSIINARMKDIDSKENK